jgi:hypothetical protein
MLLCLHSTPSLCHPCPLVARLIRHGLASASAQKKSREEYYKAVANPDTVVEDALGVHRFVNENRIERISGNGMQPFNSIH